MEADLPEGWAWCKLQDIADVAMGNSPPGDTYNSRGDGVPLVNGPMEFSAGPFGMTQKGKYTTAPSQICEKGDLLVCVRGATTGRTNIAAFSACIGRGVALVRACEDQAYLNLVMWWLGPRLLEAGKGTTFPSVSYVDLAGMAIPFPPLREQRRIVARLEELTARTRAARAALEALPPLMDRFRQSVLAAAFRGDLTADWRARNPDVEPASELLKRIRAERRRRWEEAELDKMRAKGKVPGDDRWKANYVEPEGVDAEGLPELPEGWAWATVGELTSEPLRTGVSIRGSDAPPGTPSLKLSAIRSRQVDYSMVKYVQASPEIATENCVRGGDVFIARGNGSINLVGRCAQAVEPPELTIFPDLMIRVRCVSQMPATLFTILWDSPETRRIIEQKAKTTAGIWKVSQSDIARIPLPVPSRQEAEALVERVEDMLSSAQKESTTTETATTMLTALRQSLLAKAFRGELVPQDPADEPASVLLERIRKEREAVGGDSQRKRGRQAR